MKRKGTVLGWRAIARVLATKFPERQLLLRTDGQIRYLRVSHRLQVACLSVLAVLGGWSAFTSITYFVFDDILRSKDVQISNAHADYRNLLGEVNQYQARFSVLTKELQKNHSMMLDLVENNATLQLNLRSAQKNLEASRVQQVEINQARNALRNKLASIESELGTLNNRNFELRGNLQAVSTDLQTALNERAETQMTNHKLRAQVSQLESEVSELHRTESEVIARLTQRTQDGIVFMEQVFARTGLNVDEFLAQFTDSAIETAVGTREDEAEPSADGADETAEALEDGEEQAFEVASANIEEVVGEEEPQVPGIEMTIARRPTGQGGPFFAPVAPRPDAGEKLRASLSDLESRLGRLDDLRQLMRAAPLPAPLDQFQLSSKFGKRKDPIRQRLAMHYGLDLRAPLGSPVYSTAPGVVTIAASRQEYGRMVEIDHGMGFKTRYAHLSKILVKVGQEVDYRDKIGLLGNSGRSTGPHLHYEIAHNGRPIDPMRFLKAGKYVYKGQ